jgi:hypothetical protein
MTWFYTGGGREKWNFFDFAIGILRLFEIKINSYGQTIHQQLHII